MPKTPRNSFDVLYKSISKPLKKFIYRQVEGNQNAVDEVFQRTIIAAWKSWDTFNSKSSYLTWICRIALNKAADYYREEIHRNSRIVAPILEDVASYDASKLTPEEWYVLNELCNSVKECVRLLPAKTQKLLFMRYWKGWAIRKIARELHTSDRAIEGKIYRAKQKLKEIIADRRPEIAKLYSKSLAN